MVLGRVSYWLGTAYAVAPCTMHALPRLCSSSNKKGALACLPGKGRINLFYTTNKSNPSRIDSIKPSKAQGRSQTLFSKIIVKAFNFRNARRIHKG